MFFFIVKPLTLGDIRSTQITWLNDTSSKWWIWKVRLYLTLDNCFWESLFVSDTLRDFTIVLDFFLDILIEKTFSYVFC